MTILPRSAPPEFSATVALDPGDSTAGPRGSDRDRRVRLIWNGQRRVPGIDPGINLAFEGMVSMVDGIRTIHNPRYEIVGRPEESP
ncbi:single stranded DNA-binding domain-containing protein [Arthrobacter sp.]|uniref:hypothetical protein n=1 Tax=Arthrobacter sp. TaxID=1667 RepID=UPI002811FA17|nr:hypothetical protein [Arthrobacter sp.]